MSVLPVSTIALLVSCLTFSNAIPTPQSSTATSTGTSSTNEHAVINSQMESSANGITVSLTVSQVNDKCVANLKIYGKGIDKTAEYPCNKESVEVINLEDGLVVGKEWFSDKPGTLVHLTDDKCEEEVFQDGKPSSSPKALSEEECQKVQAKISELKKEDEKVKNWQAQQELALQHQLQQNFQWFQNQMAGLFGGK